MNERPILFSAEMVRAILDGRKTQTRRVIKPQPASGMRWGFNGWEDGHGRGMRCPYGAAGDRLWVRESHYRYGHWEPVPGVKTKTGRMKWRFVGDSDEVRYADNPPAEFRRGMHHRDPATPAWHRRPSQFMFRKHARILLEVIGVRVERVQDITPEDCMAEGIGGGQLDSVLPATAWREAFHDLWDRINAARGYGWNMNPWVWVVEFRKV